jgi:hypothetical protein
MRAETSNRWLARVVAWLRRQARDERDERDSLPLPW